MGALARQSHVFIRPGALSDADLEKWIEAIDTGAKECGIAFQYKTTTQALDSLLAIVRSCKTKVCTRELCLASAVIFSDLSRPLQRVDNKCHRSGLPPAT